MSFQKLFFNPTDEQRHELLKAALNNVGRTEDYENIIELLGPGPDIMELSPKNSLKNYNIGIIGAGLTGLAAAYELRKLGANITIYDAESTRIGGRIYTQYFNNSTKYFGELGAMRIPITHETTWHYINLFGLNTESLVSANSNNFLYAHNIRMRRSNSNVIEEFLYPLYNLTENEKNTPWPQLSSYADTTMFNNLTSEQRTEILKILPQYSDEYAILTKMSNREVYEELGLSQGFINLMSAVNPISASALNLSYNKTMGNIYTFDFQNTYRIPEGIIKLPLAFISSLIRNNSLGNVAIKFGHAVNGISQTSDNYINLQYTNPLGNQLTESFDLVVCTVPFSVLRDFDIDPLFSNTKMQAIREFNYIDAQKTAIFFNKRFWEEDQPYGKVNGGISFTDLIIQSIIYPSDHLHCENSEDCTYNEPGTLLASYNMGQDALRLSNQNLYRRLAKIIKNVEKVHGTPEGYIETLIENYKTVHWNSEQWSRGAFAAELPGQKINFAYNMIQPEYNNRLYFAGEHISTKPGWMQGSLQTGKWVANQIATQT